MSQTVAGTSWGRAALWLLACLVLAGVVLSSANLSQLVAEAAGRITLLSVMATLPAQGAAAVICAAALWVLRPGVSYLACLASRFLRDASGNLPVSLPGFSAAMGARALILAGGGTRTAITAIAIDKFAESMGQIPFIALAVAVFWQELHAPWLMFDGAMWAALAALLALGALGTGLVLRLRIGTRVAARIAQEWRMLAAEARRQRAGIPLCLALHVVAWAAGGVQIWMAAGALGYGVTLYEAIAIESAAYAGRAIFFFIPAGLVTQEAALVAAGLAFGLDAPQSLALGLILRLRDVVMAAPLLVWPLFEYRYGRRPGY